MTRRLRWLGITSGFLAVLALSCETAVAADKSKVDRATKRVQRGAKQIGQGNVGPGLKEMLTGVGHTFVEGAKFSAENIKEGAAGRRSSGAVVTRGQRL
jgi:predicted ribonuclease toxin of YeeF-YezG toxin-antitoxin module